MSVQAITWAMAQRTGTITRKAVLMALANCHNHHTGRCFPKVETLALELDCSERTVQRALSDLEEQGLILRVETRRADGSQGPNQYWLALDRLSAQGDSVSPPQGVNLSPPTEPEVNLEPSEANASAQNGQSQFPRPHMQEIGKSPTTAQTLMAEVVDSAQNHHVYLGPRTKGHLASEIKKLLDDGATPDQVRAGIARMAERRMFQPSLLPNFVTEAAIPKQQPLRYGRGMTAQQVLDRYGAQE